jgi:hypothetical protein
MGGQSPCHKSFEMINVYAAVHRPGAACGGLLKLEGSASLSLNTMQFDTIITHNACLSVITPIRSLQ